MMKAIVDELALAQCPVNGEELVITILSSLALELNQIATALRAYETEISYVELYNKLIDFETVLKQQDVLANTSQSVNYI